MSERSAYVVSQVARDAHAAVGSVLARAFHGDPLWTVTFPDPHERPSKLKSMFTALSKATVAARGVVDVTLRTRELHSGHDQGRTSASGRCCDRGLASCVSR